MKLVGKVSEEEKIELSSLFERLNGIRELIQTYDIEELTKDGDALYEKLVLDTGKTRAKFQQWWDEKAKKYNWEKTDTGKWQINFETNEIYLV